MMDEQRPLELNISDEVKESVKAKMAEERNKILKTLKRNLEEREANARKAYEAAKCQDCKEKDEIIGRLREALDAATNVGIYPKESIGGSKPYKERDDYMNGWNEYAMASLTVINNILHPGDWK
jgi:LPS O-antigen subunit length determinant protein (WzzB/FepE family)